MSGPALWYLNRSTGLVVLVLLTMTTVMGVTATARTNPTWWPRVASVDLHRRLSMLSVSLLLVHVLSAVADSYVDIQVGDSFVPFQSPYRTVWLGLGTVAMDLLVAVFVTSALRHRMTPRGWKLVHLSAYLAWPPAVMHGLGTGTDTGSPVGLVLTFTCVGAVAGALVWRLTTAGLGALGGARAPSHARRPSGGRVAG